MSRRLLSIPALATLLAACGAPFEASAETRFLERDGGQIAYDDTGGEGPLVLAIPGLGDVRAEYRFLKEELAAAGYRVVTMDVRGHGESSTGWDDYSAMAIGEDALALVEHLDAGPALLVGTSMGAGAAAFAAAEEPGQVSGLVLIGPFVRDHEMNPVMGVATWAMFSGPWKVDAWLWYVDSLYPTKKPGDWEAYRAQLAANLHEPGRFDALLGMFRASKAEVEARLPDVKAPTLVVMGTKDPDFPSPKAEAELVAERLSGEVVLVEGAGHYPHAEMPEVTAPAILDFFAGLSKE